MAYRRKPTPDVTIYDLARAFDGYTLFAPTFNSDAWLIDMKGRIVNHWSLKHPPASHGRLLPNGNLLWQAKGPGSKEKDFTGAGTELVEYDWNGKEIWRYEEVGLNHDFLPLPNGNVIVNVYAEVPENIRKRVKGGIPGTEAGGRMFSAWFKEIDRAGKCVWDWKMYEHLDPDRHRICPLCDRRIWGFNNALALMPDGQLLFTMRLMNRVCILDRRTGTIVWEFGEEQGEPLGHPHCCTALDNGRVLLYDNGLHRKTLDPALSLTDFSASRVIEIDPKTNKVVWCYQDALSPDFFSAICSGAQRLPNGNTLICEATRGRFFEVTLDTKEIVWEYHSPFIVPRPSYWNWTLSATIYQAHRYPHDYPAFRGRNMDPEQWEWVIRKKSQATVREEGVLKRLESLGY